MLWHDHFRSHTLLTHFETCGSENVHHTESQGLPHINAKEYLCFVNRNQLWAYRL